MDAFTLQKKLIVIPTPGQSEQQYLAKKLSEAGAVWYVPQENFQLARVVGAVANHSFSIPAVPDTLLPQAVRSWLQTFTMA
jgi:UDP-N-acetylglucosamine:LPS N-acetylglucosamine transferase